MDDMIADYRRDERQLALVEAKRDAEADEREARNHARRKSYQKMSQDPAWLEKHRAVARWKMRELRENRIAAGLRYDGKPRAETLRLASAERLAKRLAEIQAAQAGP